MGASPVGTKHRRKEMVKSKGGRKRKTLKVTSWPSQNERRKSQKVVKGDQK